MSVLTPTKIYGVIEAVGLNPSRDSQLATDAADRLTLDLGGIVGDSHYGAERAACVRVQRYYPKGSAIRNVRQLTLVSVEELAQVAASMGIDSLNPLWIGANLAISGIPDLTQLPAATRLIFDNGTSLVTDTENLPCRLAADSIDLFLPGAGAAFVNAAKGLRGVTAWVERAGAVGTGDRCRVNLPQRYDYVWG